MRDRVSTAVTSLLGLLGIAADPIQSREHILLSSLFTNAWASGLDLSLPSLIQQIQKPPFVKVGVLDLESFYPAKDRFELAMLINNLLAAPGFQTWLEGEPLDIGRMLFTPEGKARVSIFSIAHLSDAERMFFVSMLLNEVLGWVRAQPGTGSLRAIVYMDEIFGFFPPVAEPPSKKPLLTLLKQARAFGVGILLATQNPVDLDYKGLANAGTWFIGRLQTERDKDRLLEGLEGVAAGTEGGLRPPEDGRDPRRPGQEDLPHVQRARGRPGDLPDALDHVVPGRASDPGADQDPDGPAAARSGGASGGRHAGGRDRSGRRRRRRRRPRSGRARRRLHVERLRPTCPRRSPSSIFPCAAPSLRVPLSSTDRASWQRGRSTSSVRSPGAARPAKIRRIAQAPESALAVDWDAATPLEPLLEDLDRQPYAGATLAPPPAAMTKVTSYRSWGSDFSAWAFRTQTMELFKSAVYRMTSNPGRDRRGVPGPSATSGPRVPGRSQRQAAPEIRGQDRRPSISRRCALSRRLRGRRSRPRRARCRLPSRSARRLWAPSSGRKAMSTGTLGRATTTMRDVGRSMDEAGDVKRAEETLETVKQRRADLEAEFQSELDALEGRDDPGAESLEKVLLRPRKSDITVDSLGLVWMPYWQDGNGSLSTGAWG